MGHANGKITAPVNTDDVSLTIGEASHDVKTLCMSAKVNRWSRYKPVIIDSPDQVHGNADPQYWYRGDDGQCGLIVPKGAPGANGTAVANLYKGDAWKRIPLTAANLGRIVDFEGYDHGAKPFLYTGIKKGDERNVNLSFNEPIRLTVHTRSIEGSLSLDDFEDIGMDSNCKLVAAVYRTDPMTATSPATSPAMVRSVTSEQTVAEAANGVLSVDVDFSKTDLQAASDYWVLLYLVGTSAGSAAFPIPWDDDNYFVTKVNLTETYALKAVILNIATGNGSESSPVPTNGGEADIPISLQFTSGYDEAVTVGPGGRFRLRAELGSGYGNVELTGAPVTVPGKSTNMQGTFTAPKLFRQAVSMLKPSVTKDSATFRIAVLDTAGASQSWQQLTAQQTIWFKR